MFKKLISMFLVGAVAFSLVGCDDVQIFKEKEKKGVQKLLKANELEINKYYVKDGTSFIETLPLHGSGKEGKPENTLSKKNKRRVLYAGPYEDTLIPTHYRGEIVGQASAGSAWDSVFLERFKDMGYSIGFYNAEYDRDNNSLNFDLIESGIKGTDAFEIMSGLESRDIRVVEVNHQPLSVDNANFDSGVLVGMKKNEKYTISLYSGTYYHEIDITADTQMFQSFEMYSFGSDYIQDTPNGYRSFSMPTVLKSGYYAIDMSGLYRYVDFAKGDGNIAKAEYNEDYYTNDQDRLANFSRQYSYTVDMRTKNLTVEAVYDEHSVIDEENVEGYVFAPDGTEYYMNVDRNKNKIWTDFAQTMPGKWTANIVPVDIEITEFNAIDNTPDQALTQDVYNFDISEAKENVVFKVYFTKTDPEQKFEDIEINGNMIAPNGETYILEKNREEDKDKNEYYYLKYRLAYAPPGKYTITINHYPEKTIVQDPQVTSDYENVTETIVVDG